MMERVSEPRVSPDGRQILEAVRTTDWDGNKGVNSLWLADVAPGQHSGEPRKLAISEGGASGARWAPDGGAIYFLSSRGGSNQVWRTDAAGMAAAQVTTLPFDVSGFRIAPDGKSLVLAVSVVVDCDTLACTKTRLDARGKSTLQSYDRLPLRDFDHWVDTRRTHLFVQPLNGSGLSGGEPRDLLAGLDADVSAGDSSFDISPDGRTLVYGTQTQGAGEAFTSNSDVFRVALGGGAPVLALVHDVRMGAGEAGEPVEHGYLLAGEGLGRQIDRKIHLAAEQAGTVAIALVPAAEALVAGNDFKGHEQASRRWKPRGLPPVEVDKPSGDGVIHPGDQK